MAALAALTAAACAGEQAGQPGLAVTDLLGGEPDPGFARVLGPRPFVFPEDHGPHPAFKTEWWYVTANLMDDDGNRFGVQLTFFRSALAPPAPAPDPAFPDSVSSETVERSAWGEPQAYMAHAALTDVTRDRFLSEERLSRPALELAGARARPFRVWLEDWELASVAPSDGDVFPLRLFAEVGEAGVDLRLDRGKPVALQGDRGFSPKGPGVGDASHYYSFTRLPATGEITVDGRPRAVRGTAWFDREWSTSVLGRNQVGWDWFALQLADGRDLMVFRLRATDGDDMRDGLVVETDGRHRRLAPEAFEIEVLDHWTSPDGDARYPSRWRIRVPAEGIDAVVEPWTADQEHRGLFRYWEGAVRVTGEEGAAGVGYVELTGYASPDAPGG